jgi:hypothetical protein
VGGQKLAEQDEEQSPERRAQEVAHAADHGHGDDLARERHVDHVRGDEIAKESKQAARETEKRGRENEPDQLVTPDRIADEGRPLLVLADRHQHAPERRVDEPPDTRAREEYDQGTEQIERAVIVEIDAEQVWPGDPAQPVLAAGERGPAKHDVENQGGERQGEQREIDAAAAQHEEPDDQAGKRGDDDREQDRDDEAAGPDQQLKQRRRVGGEADERAVAKRQQARVAEQQVEAEADQREQDDLGGDEGRKADRLHGKRQDPQRGGQDHERVPQDAEAVHSSRSSRSPISPRGRSSSTSTMSAYIEASAAGG